MSYIKLFTYNILELGTVTVTGTPDTGFPEERLYDRSIGFYWKYTNTGDISIEVDQGASGNLAVDALIIDKHNFNGRTMHWEYSDNGSDWTPAVTSWAQGDNNQIVKTLSAAITHRYWRVRVISAVNPQCTEVYIGYGYPFQVRFDEPPEESDLDNVVWEETIGGLENSNKLGEERNLRSYSVFLDDGIGSSLTLWKTAKSYLDSYSKPFYLKDHEDNYKFSRFATIPRLQFITGVQVLSRWEFREMLG